MMQTHASYVKNSGGLKMPASMITCEDFVMHPLARHLSLIGLVLALKTPAALAADREPFEDMRWDYKKTDDEWARLSEDYAACHSGVEQSPVNLITGDNTPAKVKPPLYSYGKQINATLLQDYRRFRLLPTGRHQVRFNYKSYTLKYIAVHTPAEHTIDYKAEPMEFEFHHLSKDGKRLVISSIFTRQKEATNPSLEAVLELAEAKDKTATIALAVDDLLPQQHRYLMYNASLTHPPCTEGFSWLVLRDRVLLSPQQFSRFAKLIGRNARPLQKRSPLIIQTIDEK